MRLGRLPSLWIVASALLIGAFAYLVVFVLYGHDDRPPTRDEFHLPIHRKSNLFASLNQNADIRYVARHPKLFDVSDVCGLSVWKNPSRVTMWAGLGTPPLLDGGVDWKDYPTRVGPISVDGPLADQLLLLFQDPDIYLSLGKSCVSGYQYRLEVSGVDSAIVVNIDVYCKHFDVYQGEQCIAYGDYDLAADQFHNIIRRIMQKHCYPEIANTSGDSER